MMERLAAPERPHERQDHPRPPTASPPSASLFVQCAGSRDRLHLPYCSAVCCLASLKQAGYVRAQHPDAEITMCYIDVRAPGKLEDFSVKAQAENKMTMIKGKVAKVTEDAATGEVTVEVEDVLGGGLRRIAVDLVVLATGMPPATTGLPGVAYDTQRLRHRPRRRGAGLRRRLREETPRRRRHGAGRHRGRPQGHPGHGKELGAWRRRSESTSAAAAASARASTSRSSPPSRSARGARSSRPTPASAARRATP